MLRRLAALAVLSMVLTSSAAATPPRTLAPPGNSAIDEYVETIPGAGGDQPPAGPGGGNSSAGGLDGAERRRLEHLGQDGARLASVVDRTSATARPRTAHAGDGRPNGTAAATDPPAGSPVGAVLAAAVGSHDDGGLGLLLPVVLLVSLLGTVALGVARRRPPA